jgi:hypothetical protein
MRKLLAAALLLTAASGASIALAQDIDKPKPEVIVAEPPLPAVVPHVPDLTPDARTMASDQDVGQARRAYRAACSQHENAGYCDCVTAGVAQALLPAEVRMAARTFGERIPAQGDSYAASDSDRTHNAENSQSRIEQVEGHYADACASLRT